MDKRSSKDKESSSRTGMVPKSELLVYGDKTKSMKSQMVELPTKIQPASQSNAFSTERIQTNQPNEQSLKGQLTSQIKEPSMERKLTFVCISDTHCRVKKQDARRIPHGDVLLHTGDFTMNGSVRELLEFNEFLGALPHTYKVVIAGNHDSCLEDDTCTSWDGKYMNKYYKEKYGVPRIRDLLTNCIYLQDEQVEICGIRIYGSPWTQKYSSCSAFSLPSSKSRQQKWDKIPEGVDILMTHGPPRGLGDTTAKEVSAGCRYLMNEVKTRVKPKYHVFGHIHEGYGVYNDGMTTYINASICTRGYKPTNRPVKFRLKIDRSAGGASASCDIQRTGCDVLKKNCDLPNCDTETTGSDSFNKNCVSNTSRCDSMSFDGKDCSSDISTFVDCAKSCDTKNLDTNVCDKLKYLDCDSESTNRNTGQHRPELDLYETELRDCATSWSWGENDGTKLNYTELTSCEMSFKPKEVHID